MFGSFRIGSLLGIPLQISPSWFIIAAIVTWSLITGQFPIMYPDWDQRTYIVAGVVSSFLFFSSVVAHELAHSLIARKLGVPVRSITLFIFGGVAQITRDVALPAGELVMAAAGPISSFLLSVLFSILWLAIRRFNEPTAAVMGWLAWINMTLGVFNLIPGFPMDGGRMLRSLLWWATGNFRLATRIAISVGKSIAGLFIIGGIWFWAQNPTGSLNSAWFLLVGWFLLQAASGSGRQSNLRGSLQGYTARNIMNTDMVSTTIHATVDQFVESTASKHERWWFIVVDGATLKGLVTLDNLGRLPKESWPFTRLASVMTPVDKLPVIRPDAEATEVLEMMEEHRVRELIVVENNQLLGVITQTAVFRLVQGRFRR